ncbi:MAG: Uma2 family endonuclease [Emticicia sp.]|nr:Uma2 family endonuclease [Emticicia sp.]
MVITKSLKDEIIKQLETNELVQIPASEEDYFSIAYTIPFKVEYHDNEIITMGLASYLHEKLTARFIILLNQIFELVEEEFDILGSNTGVQIPKFEGGYYMPDVTVVKDEPVFKENSTAIITNPYIIVEVLSPATSTFDKEHKLPEYKHLESLQQIIYVSPKKVFVSTYIRSENPNIWLNQDFYNLEDFIVVEGVNISLSDIYKKIKFDK